MNKYKYNELHGKIIAKFGTLGDAAKALHMSSYSLSKKLSGDSNWKKNEMSNITNILSLTDSDIKALFLL